MARRAPVEVWLIALICLYMQIASAKPSSASDSSNNSVNRHQIRHSKHRNHRERPQSDAASGANMAEVPPEATPADAATINGYVERNCSSCLLREEAKLARVERIKEDLLKKLGFASVPNASASRDVPSFAGPFGHMLDELGFKDQQSDSPQIYRPSLVAEDPSAKTERVYSFARSPPEHLRTAGDVKVAYFVFSQDTMDNDVTEAMLNVYFRPTSQIVQDTKMTIKLEIFPITAKGMPNEAVRTIKYRHSVNRGQWYSLSVRQLVQEWFHKPEHNYGIHVKASYKEDNLAVHPTDGGSETNMYLDIETVDGEKAKRRRRSAPNIDCREDQQERRCCRYPLVIDFDKFGWDFVIAPKKYMAWYCSGECPFRYLQRYVHTHLVSQALPDGSAGPCCYPTELAPIMMVYLNDQKEVLVSQVPSMVANRCGCA